MRSETSRAVDARTSRSRSGEAGSHSDTSGPSDCARRDLHSPVSRLPKKTPVGKAASAAATLPATYGAGNQDDLTELRSGREDAVAADQSVNLDPEGKESDQVSQANQPQKEPTGKEETRCHSGDRITGLTGFWGHRITRQDQF